MPDEPAQPRSLIQLFLGFLSVGMYGFGGVLPWARRLIVEQKRWLSASEFTDMLGAVGTAAVTVVATLLLLFTRIHPLLILAKAAALGASGILT